MLRILFALTAILSLAACASSGRVAENAGQPGRETGPEPAGVTPVSAPGTQHDRRVIAYDPRTRLFMILVNTGHSGRASEAGRRALALGRPDVAYKVIGEDAMEALFESMRNRGAFSTATPVTDQDRRYFGSQADISENYRGIILIEEDGQPLKVLGFRALGDGAGQVRLKLFTDLKYLVTHWFNLRSEIERPSWHVESLP
jgi:hypothetical protein